VAHVAAIVRCWVEMKSGSRRWIVRDAFRIGDVEVIGKTELPPRRSATPGAVTSGLISPVGGPRLEKAPMFSGHS